MHIKSMSVTLVMSLLVPSLVRGQDAEVGPLLEGVVVTARKGVESGA